jgi:hypothetical protein
MRAIAHRIAVKMKPLMTVPQSESNGFFTYSLLEFVCWERELRAPRECPPRCPKAAALSTAGFA